MTTRRTKSEREMREELRGSFKLDGQWERGFGDRITATEHYVRLLVRSRLASQLSPAQLADRIAAGLHAQAFGELDQWRTLTGWTDWPLAHCRTSADSAVKYCGVGSPQEAHWEGGTYVVGNDQRPFDHASAEKIAQFVTSLGQSLGG